MTRTLLISLLAACGGGGGAPSADAPALGADAMGSGTKTLSDDHPGDVGLGGDPHVVWFEDFEEGTVAAVTGRYDQAQGMERMQLVSDAPAGMALSLTAGGAVSAVDLFKRLPDHDDVYVRWYVKYDAGAPWHHSGVWFGGYNPSQTYPSPGAGTLPTGDDRFSISIEPIYDIGGAATRLDFYNYWRGMHSWMQPVTNDGTSYYGNSVVHRDAFTADGGQWMCLEVHVRLNTDASSSAGGMLEVWKNDAVVSRFDATGPMGYWVRDKFCAADADASECTSYPAPANELLDLQLRTVTSYGVNAFWPQNYITDAAMGTLRFDQMVVATSRIGCMR